MSSKTRKIWESSNGPIPREPNGRSYEIHHKNGNNKDDRLENMELLTIQGHFDIHLEQQDFAACALIAKRMGLPPTFISDIQRGGKRPGVGGAPKGRIPWNKGVTGYKLDTDRKGKIWSHKLNISDVRTIKRLYSEQYKYDDFLIYSDVKNNPRIKYERYLSKYLSEIYNLNPVTIYNVIKGKCWTNV